MIKSELIERLAQKAGITSRAATVAVEVVVESMAAALVRGDRVEVRGLGAFSVRNYEEYEGRNPKTGEVIQVKGKRLPAFRVGRELKERVDPPGEK